MKDEPTLTAACELLDLPLDPQPLQVAHAFRRKQALYADGALATYCLLDDGTRQALLERLESAYRKVAAATGEALRPRAAAGAFLPTATDPSAAPGPFLRARREAAGLSLREVAERTKISPMKIRQIEEECYAQLPAPVYLRGFVVAYARMLGLPDGEALAGSFLQRRRAMIAEG